MCLTHCPNSGDHTTDTLHHLNKTTMNDIINTELLQTKDYLSVKDMMTTFSYS